MARADRDGEPGTAELRSLGLLAAWFSSILLLFGSIGFVNVYHLSTLLPVLCIGAAVLILWVAGRAGRLTRGAGDRTRDRTALIAVAVIGLAGLLTTGVIVHSDAQSPEWEAVSFLLRNYSDDPDTVKIVPFTSHWLLSDVYGLQNTAQFYSLHKQIQGVRVEPGLARQDATGFSDHYVWLDAERVILVFNNQEKKAFMNIMEACDYATNNFDVHCHTAHMMLRLYKGDNIINAFEHRELADAFPQITPHIERYLTNQYRVVEWVPANRACRRSIVRRMLKTCLSDGPGAGFPDTSESVRRSIFNIRFTSNPFAGHVTDIGGYG